MNPENAPATTPIPTPQPGIGMAPQPAPAPAPQPDPTPAPAPEQNPWNPQPTPQPEQQPQPQQPAPQDQPQPEQNVQPQPQTDAPKAQLSYEEYLDSLIKDIPEAPAAPNPADIDKDDPEGLTKFFDDYRKSIVAEAQSNMQREAIVQNAEASAWKDVFVKYPEIESNKQLRDTVHNIRVGAFSRGEALSPIQVADALVGNLHDQYRKGVNDTNVQVRVQDSQPLNGGGQPQPQAQGVNYEALQKGGQNAAVSQIEAMIAAGRI